jgi:hypothetical protein
MEPAQQRMRVLLIAGLGRSGSTVLGRLLAQLPGFTVVGELGLLWRNGFVDDVLCGCGEPIQACAFWRAAVGKAFGGFDGVPAHTLGALLAFWDARRRLALRLASPLPLSGAQQAALDTYARHVARVLAGVHAASGCRVIVDTSKTPAHLIALAACPSVELHVVHLIRDSRAVAHSWRQLRRRRQVRDAEVYIEPVSPPRTALLWNGINTLTWSLRRQARSYRRVRYEDFAAAPRDVLTGLLQPLGETLNATALDAGPLRLDVHHTVAGNSGRFDSGPTEVRLDDAWTRAMPFGARVAVTALTWPLLLAYGYPLLPHGPVRAEAEAARTSS